MLWTFLDVAAAIVAIGLILFFGPSVIGLSKWKQRLHRSIEENRAAGAEPRVQRRLTK